MEKVNEISKQDAAFIDNRTINFVRYMCKKCKFYDNECTKGRLVEKCALNNLKNKE